MIKRISLLLGLITFVLLLLTSTALADEAVVGKIEGRLINGTQGSTSSVADREITLKINKDNSEVSSKTTVTDAEGRYVFEGLSTSANYSYQETLIYQGAEYFGEPLTFAEGETSKTADINVYDSTTDNVPISIMMEHTIIYVEQESLLVKEYIMFVNESDLAYVGSKEIPGENKTETLVFSLPEKATNLQIGSGLVSSGVYVSQDGFVDTTAVLPGARELSYSYEIPVSGDYVFLKKIGYPTINYGLLVESGSVPIVSSHLTQQEPLEISGHQFSFFSGNNFSPGDTLTAQLSSLPEGNSQMIFIWVAIALLILVSASIAVYILRKRRLQPVRFENRLTGREGLLAELAQLDDDFEGGKIDEEAYRRLRAEKKSQLVTLMQVTEESRGDK